jgi:large subunit ribosomal protein L4
MTTKVTIEKEAKKVKKVKAPVSLEATVFAQDGKKKGTLALPEKVFALPWNADLVHQVVTGMEANARQNNAHTKDRAEIRGGGRKPWKQKGTGRARHGSSRSPIWRKGGVAFGPRNERDYSVAIPKKMRAKALYTTLSKKWQDGEILFIDKLTLPEIKAKLAREALTHLGGISGFDAVGTRRKNAAFIALAENDNVVSKSFGNFGNVHVASVKDLNAVDVLKYKVLVLVGAEDGIKFIESKL